jgi:acetamidase/formamidase
VCLTAIETNLTGVFRFTVRKNMKLRWPRAETPTHVITMGLHENLEVAARRATKEMIDYLTAEPVRYQVLPLDGEVTAP